MATPVTVYRWDDAGAPQIVDGKPTEYINLFKKCLVEGYGEKQGLGWQVQDESPLNQISFMNAGSGGSFVFGSESGGDIAGEKIKMQCCQSFIDFDNLVQPSQYSLYRTNYSGTFKEWMIIGTNAAFYFVNKRENQTKPANLVYTTYPVFFVGDFKPFTPGDQNTFIFWGGHSGSDHTNPASAQYISGQMVDSSMGRIIRTYTMDSPPQQVDCSIVNLIGNGRHNSLDSVIKKQTPEVTFLSPNYLTISNSAYHNDAYAESNNSVTNPLIRGLIPGLYVSQQTGFYDELLYFIKKINGVDYFNIPSTNNAASAVWINMEEW
ncbi:hypothetical protein [Pseudoalteromonas rhizosphaerae]|uniref:hypothetical protein n=1 Tax=Pseudoalteromonas rhizosphaerae TaxID=2518973 RepID=UPI0021477AFE|nr:hypothetical protein [Pseudoalteromonas rhizosphaerae]